VRICEEVPKCLCKKAFENVASKTDSVGEKKKRQTHIGTPTKKSSHTNPLSLIVSSPAKTNGGKAKKEKAKVQKNKAHSKTLCLSNSTLFFV